MLKIPKHLYCLVTFSQKLLPKYESKLYEDIRHKAEKKAIQKAYLNIEESKFTEGFFEYLINKKEYNEKVFANVATFQSIYFDIFVELLKENPGQIVPAYDKILNIITKQVLTS